MTEPTASTRFQRLRQQIADWLTLREGTLFDRLLVIVLVIVGALFSAAQLLAGDWALGLVGGAGVIFLGALASLKPLQDRIIRQPFSRAHAVYVAVFWAYSLLWVWVLRLLIASPVAGKDSRFFFIYLILFAAITFRSLMSLFALTPQGYRLFISDAKLWEKLLLAINEFVAAASFAYVVGGELARWLQPNVITIQVSPAYSLGLIFVTSMYYGLVQAMWVARWNERLSKNRFWVRLARFLTPIALGVATVVIARHFARVSEPRSADLLGTANIDQAVLALSPILWMMIFFIVILVYNSSLGLRQRFLPERLVKYLPEWLRNRLDDVSDMDLVLLFLALMAFVPVQVFLFDNGQPDVIDTLSRQLEQQNALIGTSQQALALIFALPFYAMAVLLLGMYAFVLGRGDVSADEREALVERLPVTLIIIFIITLYLAAIPFGQVLVEGRVPQLPQELAYVLVFDVLIPLALLYGHYVVFVRFPYRVGQNRWREAQSDDLRRRLRKTDNLLETVQQKIERAETIWNNRRNLRTKQDDFFNMLFDLIKLNGDRDRLNMDRTRIVSQQQALAEISETPVSLSVARLPARVFSFGVPLLIAFKLYEWAIVEGGLQEIANNPNVNLIDFFQQLFEAITI